MEMSQNVYLRRFDSLISKIDIDQLGFSSIVPQLHERVMNFYTVDYPEAKLNVKEFEPGSKSAKNIESYIEKLVEVKGWKPDVLIIDYLNLIKPNAMNAKGDSSMYQDGKVVSEELRALSYRLEIPIITAVQCNSSGFNTADIGMQNIAESRGIAHTADFIAGLYQTEEEQDNGVFHMKVLKSRLGDKKNLKFEFDKKTMEFRDINDVVGGSSMGGSTTVDSSKSSLGLPQCTEADFDPIKDDIGMP
jgi:replicative DNA helicase